ncbi:hypothetical protein BTZ20_0113 [Rhodococcus sp. MTM3W5.2]|nr:hypothetical protein BTZ20_0113 [Rhodococcus sp. MTM3W5.2]
MEYLPGSRWIGSVGPAQHETRDADARVVAYCGTEHRRTETLRRT